MSEGDVKIIKNPGENRFYDVDDRTSSGSPLTIKPGEPLQVMGAGNNFVEVLADGAPEAESDEFVGICAKESTETSSVDGKVLVTTCIPGVTVLRWKANTSTNVNTAAKLLGLKNDFVCADVATRTTTPAFTLDEDEGSDQDVHGFKIVNGDYVKYTLDTTVNSGASEAGPF